MQQLTYRDRAKFIVYVRDEVEAISRRDNATNGAISALNGGPDTPTKGASHGGLGSSLSSGAHSLLSQLNPWWRALLERFALLGGLLFLQSCSSLILVHFADFISHHIIVTLYLTMLVGAGGNAGNQAAVLVIRMLATAGSGAGGSGSSSSARSIAMPGALRLLWREVQVALILGVLLMIVGFGRVFLFEGGDLAAATAIALSLWVIVTSSVVLGAALPLALHALHFDPAHAGPLIQVCMDILGVALTCVICSMVLGDVPAAASKIR